MANRIITYFVLALIVSTAFTMFDYAYAIDNNCRTVVVKIFEQSATNSCFEDRIDALENAPAGSESTVGANVGSGAGIFRDGNVNLRSVLGSPDISVTQQADTITVDYNGTASGESTNCNNVGTGNPIHKAGTNCSAFSLIAGNDITITNTTDDYTIASTATEESTDCTMATSPTTEILKSSSGGDCIFRGLTANGGITFTQNTNDIAVASWCDNTGTGEAICEQSGSGNDINSLIAGAGMAITDTTGDLKLDALRIGQQQIFVHQSVTKTNLPNTYTDIWVTLFDMEEMTLLHPNNVTYFYISMQYDFVGAGNDQCRWVNTANNTQVLHESPTFTGDQNSYASGWFTKPASFTALIYSIEMQCKSSNGTNDPVPKGYVIYSK